MLCLLGILAGMEHRISLTKNAKKDIDYYQARHQQAIVSGILSDLRKDPEVENRKRKQIETNPAALWTLRHGAFRIFYTIPKPRTVKVVAVGRSYGFGREVEQMRGNREFMKFLKRRAGEAVVKTLELRPS